MSHFSVRELASADQEAVVALSLRAWAPVFASLEQTLGEEIFGRLHPDLRADQEKAVRGVLGAAHFQVWVAEEDGGVIGFVAATVQAEQLVGEIYMLAVEPGAQSRGVGTTLTARATDWLGQSGMRVAMIDTGGDPGPAPARRVYRKAQYPLLPIARYFRALP